MKFSTTTLGFVLSLSAVMAAPLKERAVEVATVTETYTKVVQETTVVWVAPPAKSEHPAAYTVKQYGYETSSITTTDEVVVETSTPLSSVQSTLSTSSTSSFSSLSLSSSSTESTTSSSTESTSTEATTTTESTSTKATSTSTEATSTSTEATSTSTEATSTSTEAKSTSTSSATESTTSTTVESTTSTTSTTSQEPTTSSTSVPIPSTTITTAVIPSFTPLSIPTTTQPAATSAVAKAVESAVSSGSGSGMYAGQMTYYAPGLGSCGITSGENEYIVAASYKYMWKDYSSTLNPNKNPKCGQKVMMTGPKGAQVAATIVDTCPGCDGEHDLDCTLLLFNALGCTEIDGRCQMTWSPM